MKLVKPRRPTATFPASDNLVGRRSLVAGASVAGVAAVAATALHQAATKPAEAAASAADTTAQGYRLSDHVLRYYASTKA